MVAGLGMCLYYASLTHPFFGGSITNAWLGIEPISCGFFGIPFGFVVLVIVSLLTPAPDTATQELIEHLRYPRLPHDRIDPPPARNPGP